MEWPGRAERTSYDSPGQGLSWEKRNDMSNVLGYDPVSPDDGDFCLVELQPVELGAVLRDNSLLGALCLGLYHVPTDD